MELKGTVAIVTGAARGIGRGIATCLAREGVNIVVADLDFTEAQFKDLERLYDSGLIPAFSKANPDAGAEARAAKAKELIASGYALPQIYLERLLRDELERAKPSRVYDLEFDSQLNKAIEVILGADFDTALQNSKTVSQALTPQ